MNNEMVNLPAFLRRRDGKLEMVLHCTWGQDYDLCPQKFWLRYGVQIEGAGPKPALNYGGAVHAALAHRYSSLDLSLADVEAQQMGLLEQWFDEKPQQSDEWRTTGRAQDLIRAYNEQYPAHDWEVLGVEEEFELLVGSIPGPEKWTEPSGTTYAGPLPCYLAGRKDLIVAWHDGIWVVDHKTAQDWGKGDSNSHLDEGRMSFQFRGYAWAEREGKSTLSEAMAITHPERVTLPVLGTVGNYLISRKPYAEGYAPRKGSAPPPTQPIPPGSLCLRRLYARRMARRIPGHVLGRMATLQERAVEAQAKRLRSLGPVRVLRLLRVRAGRAGGDALVKPVSAQGD